MLDNGNKSAFEKMSLVELSAGICGNKAAIEFMRDTFGNETLKKVVPSAKRLSIAAIEHEALIERQRANVPHQWQNVTRIARQSVDPMGEDGGRI